MPPPTRQGPAVSRPLPAECVEKLRERRFSEGFFAAQRDVRLLAEGAAIIRRQACRGTTTRLEGILSGRIELYLISPKNGELTKSDFFNSISPVTLLIVPTNEELMIARHTLSLVGAPADA